MKTEYYNLIEEDWIPVLMKDGTHNRVSLGEMFANGEAIADLSMVAYERISVMRLLICIAMAALDEKDLVDEPAWRKAREKIPGAVAAYFNTWHDRFNFYGPHAFMQPDGLSLFSKTSKIDKLVIEYSAGGNGTLFDHEAQSENRIISHEIRVMSMLAYQNFSACGTSSQCRWNDDITNKSVKIAPLRVNSMVHTFLSGQNILATVWLNLLTSEMIDSLPVHTRGRPLWERNNLDHQIFADKTAVNSVMWRLVPLSRIMKFEVESKTILLGEGLQYSSLPEARVFEAAVLPNSKDKTPAYVSLSDGKTAAAVWRNLNSVLSLGEQCGSLVLRHLDPDSDGDFTIWSGGLWAESGEDKNYAALEWRFTLPCAMLNDYRLQLYRVGVEFAKRVSDVGLYAASRSYYDLMKIDPKKSNSVLPKARYAFWDALEKEQPKLVRLASEEGDMAEWEGVVVETAKRSFALACPHQTGRQMAAYVQALGKLTFGTRKDTEK